MQESPLKKRFNIYTKKHRKFWLYVINTLIFSSIILNLFNKFEQGNYNSSDLFLSLIIFPCVIFQISEIYKDYKGFSDRYSKEDRIAFYGKLLKNYFLILPIAIIFFSQFWR